MNDERTARVEPPRRILTNLRVASLGLLCAALLGAQVPDPLAEIQRSHIQANVPPIASFDSLLKRDLGAYFQSRHQGAKLSVGYRLLRDGPTQAGVSYPKYYAWVQVFAKPGKVLAEGAVRVVAIEKNRFEVTDFVHAKQIRASPEALALIFPAALLSDIEKLAER